MRWLNIATVWLFVAGSILVQSTSGVQAFEITSLSDVEGKADRAVEKPPSDNVQRGLFSEGFEMASFEPCGQQERWWLQSFGGEEDPFWAEVWRLRDVYIAENNIKSAGYVSPVYYVEGRGTLSQKGQYGHMGWYQRQFFLTEVVEIRVATAEDAAGC